MGFTKSLGTLPGDPAVLGVFPGRRCAFVIHHFGGPVRYSASHVYLVSFLMRLQLISVIAIARCSMARPHDAACGQQHGGHFNNGARVARGLAFLDEFITALASHDVVPGLHLVDEAPHRVVWSL